MSNLLATLSPTLSPQQLLLMQTMVPKVHASDALLDYVQAIVRQTRESPHYEAGLSPRASIALLRAAQAWALIHGHAGVRARSGRNAGEQLSAVGLVDLEDLIVRCLSPLIASEIAIVLDIDLRGSHEFISGLVADRLQPLSSLNPDGQTLGNCWSVVRC